MRVSREILLGLILLSSIFATCISKRKRTKLHKILSKSAHGHRKDSTRVRGFKKDAVQRDNGGGTPYNQVADAFNTNRLDSVDQDELSQLQDFNKQYINNEEASETALLADHGIDDNAALKISNMASLPSEFVPRPNPSNTASKAKIGNEAEKQPQIVQGNGDDDAALMKDATSWPEYRFKDSDYSNYHIQEEVNNGPMSDNSAYGQPDNMYWQDEYGEPPHMKPRLNKPGQSGKNPALVTSQNAQAQKQDDHVTDGSPIGSGKLGIPLAANSSSDMVKAQSVDPIHDATSAQSKSANRSSTNETSTAATAPLSKQTASSPGPSSDLPASSSAAHETPPATGSAEQPTADTSNAVSQDKPTAPSTASLPTDGQLAQSLKPQGDSSKVIAKVLSGLVAGSEAQSTKGATEGQGQSQSKGQDQKGQGQAESHPQENPGVQADGLNSQPQVTKDTTSETNHPRSNTTEK